MKSCAVNNPSCPRGSLAGTTADLQIRKDGGAMEKRFKTEDVRCKNWLVRATEKISAKIDRSQNYFSGTK